MILLIDPEEDAVLDANPIASWILGYSRAELLSTPVSAILLNDMGKLRAFARLVLEEGHGWTSELTYVTRSGRLLSTEVSASAYKIGSRACVISMARDVTDSRLSEESIRESNQRLERRIRELTKSNAMFRAQLKGRGDFDPALVEVQSGGYGALDQRREPEAGPQRTIEDSPTIADNAGELSARTQCRVRARPSTRPSEGSVRRDRLVEPQSSELR